MDFIISCEQLDKWCKYKPEEIKQMSDLNADLRVRANDQDFYREVADLMLEEIKANNAKDVPTKWIVPAGPIDQWPHFIERVHAERISLSE